ncbi:inorganic pyrophosphatase [Aggregatibacter actinomycetemcomitans]|uniref:inorganic pyrophosphatase n=1 Tax=Aggregatibacter actinomycetemcomitans TaxID=714 RepID=UPI00197B8DD9|nr:inorganic pyrophosphatase [Aggregatibacter actinomycetemcomitans]MBN6064792.1 inorganic pyrophosphatase [Aggregatibacter actinomycetemcomitans]MBN6081928.1 inorganic pyrophosphatase [Aggregatibacter actinomycetemcomitans]MBN6084218.1 inorganic pyrophosphatase [Aggregatibacter actinomycetemcomitans]
MSLADTRIQDPVLTQLAQGYYNAELAGESLFPAVEIYKEGGRIPQFGRLAFRNQSTVREVRGDSNRLTPEDIKNMEIVLEEHDIEYPIDYREDNDASYPLKQYALSVVQDVIALGREVEIAKLAQNPASYLSENVVSLTGKDKFDDKEAQPLKTIDTAINAIYATIGRKPNVCVISDDVWQALKENESLLERIKYTKTGILTPEVFSELIDVKTVKVASASQEKGGKLEKIWKNVVILAYVSERAKSGGTVYDPSFGYTIRRTRGLFVDTYKEKGGKVEIIRCTDIHKPYLVGTPAGYLIKDCIK